MYHFKNFNTSRKHSRLQTSGPLLGNLRPLSISVRLKLNVY